MRSKRRAAFTIVELLVATALILFMMMILAESFSAAMLSFRSLKAAGDQAEQLRIASTTVRRLLQADHFEGRKRLSDPNFWDDGPPREGFFRVIQFAPPTYEGIASGVRSFSSVQHGLHFTAKFRGNSRSDFFPASFSGIANPGFPAAEGYRDLGSTYHTQWVEVVLFLQQTTTVDISELGTIPQPLYNLHLRMKGLIPPPPAPIPPAKVEVSTAQFNSAPGPALVDFSTYLSGGLTYFNTACDVTNPERRMGWSPPTPAANWPPPTLAAEDSSRAGSDILLNNVLSFTVRVMPAAGLSLPADFLDFEPNPALPPGTPCISSAYPQNSVAVPATGGVTPAVFDTWSQESQLSFNLPDNGNPTSPQAAGDWRKRIPRYGTTLYTATPEQFPQPPYLRIQAIQITLRIWDRKTEQTRQVTIIQDM